MAKRRYRTDATPPAPGPRDEIIRLKNANVRRFVILSAEVTGIWSHWDGERSVGCTGTDKDDCEGHRKEWPLRWKGYLHVIDSYTSKPGFLEVTPGCAKALLTFFGTSRSMRGYNLKVWRSSDKKGSRLLCEVGQPVAALEALPSERDPYPSVARLWEGDKGVDPPASEA